MKSFRSGACRLTWAVIAGVVLLSFFAALAPTTSFAKLPPPVYMPPPEYDGGGEEWDKVHDPCPVKPGFGKEGGFSPAYHATWPRTSVGDETNRTSNVRLTTIDAVSVLQFMLRMWLGS